LRPHSGFLQNQREVSYVLGPNIFRNEVDAGDARATNLEEARALIDLFLKLTLKIENLNPEMSV